MGRRQILLETVPSVCKKINPNPLVLTAATGCHTGCGGSILRVEDNTQIREMLFYILCNKGHEVLLAGDGIEALQVAAYDGNIDLLLTDVVMPRMGGGELARRLSALRSTTKVILMSGYADDKATRQGMEEADHFLHKPFRSSPVHETIGKALGKK